MNPPFLPGQVVTDGRGWFYLVGTVYPAQSYCSSGACVLTWAWAPTNNGNDRRDCHGWSVVEPQQSEPQQESEN